MESGAHSTDLANADRAFFEPFAFFECHRQVVVGDSEIGVEFERMLECLDCARVHVHASQQTSDVGVSLGAIRIDCEARLVARKRLFFLPNPQARAPS